MVVRLVVSEERSTWSRVDVKEDREELVDLETLVEAQKPRVQQHDACQSDPDRWPEPPRMGSGPACCEKSSKEAVGARGRSRPGRLTPAHEPNRTAPCCVRRGADP